MSSSQPLNKDVAGLATAAGVDQKIEVVVIPVSDVERAKRFYGDLGWRLDADFAHEDDWRVVQMTPPGSPCSVMFGKGLTAAEPGSVRGTFLVVNDVDAARAELTGRGADVTDVFHFTGNLIQVIGTRGREAGRDPDDRSYFSFASFADPDGNTWLLQQVTSRFPGRGFSVDVATLTELLREAEHRHGEYEPVGPKHHWSEWYAPYIVARQRGRTAEEAASEAGLSVAGTRAHAPA